MHEVKWEAGCCTFLSDEEARAVFELSQCLFISLKTFFWNVLLDLRAIDICETLASMAIKKTHVY